MPGRGVRVALDLAAFGLLVLLVVRVLHRSGSRFTFPTSSQRRPRGLPRRVPARRPRHAARDRGRRCIPRSDVGRVLGCRPLRWIGVRSYSLYLWHYPIFCVTRPGLDIHRSHLVRLATGLAVCVARALVRGGRALVSASSRRRSAAARSAATSTGIRTRARRRTANGSRGAASLVVARVGAHGGRARRRPRARAGQTPHDRSRRSTPRPRDARATRATTPTRRRSRRLRAAARREHHDA